MNMTTVSLRPLLEDDKTIASQLQVADEQEGFVEPANTILANISPKTHGHAIIQHATTHDEAMIGLFLIDTNYPEDYDFCPENNLGLRSFFIDSHHQGKGFGKAAVKRLKIYLQQIYKNREAVYLTVNCKNPAAKHCYEQGGFVDTQELYHGGDFGPQHILKLELGEIQR